MGRYSEETVNNVNREADIRVILGADITKTSQYVDCPFCGAKKKYRISFNARNNSARCYVCKEGYANPIAAYMGVNHLGSDRYREAIEECAKIAGITIMTDEEERSDRISRADSAQRGSFCAKQLEGSGLKIEDVVATIIDGTSESLISPFQPGTFGTGFRVDPKGSDMVIRYFDLHGRPMTYSVKGTSTPYHYVRVRYQNPDLHVGKDGKTMKYQTPTGAPSRAYIPQYIRTRFQSGTQIETLFLQEGEKKAEKACKHGMPSLGLQGINNIGSSSSGLLQDIQDVIKTCQVKNVVFMFDSDWDDLHKNITVNDRVDKRPNAFAAAVIKYKQFMMSLRNIDIDVETWWGHVNDNDFCDKGMDDLLCNTLKTRESELMKDAQMAMNSHNGIGQFVTILKISTMTDMKIRELWSLGDHQAFFERHRKQLEQISSFRIGGVRFKVEDGKMTVLSKYSSESDIFTVTENEKGAKKISVNYKEMMQFLGDSGFKIMLDQDPESSNFDYIHIDDGIVSRTSGFKIRNFVCDYVLANVKDPMVHEYFMSKSDSVLADKKLERLPVIFDEFSNIEPLVQRTYYNNGQVEITPNSITPGKTINNVWRSRIVPRNFVRVPIIKTFEKEGDHYNVEFTPEGMKSDFVRYLINTSNNYYTHNAPREVTDDEAFEWAQQLANKITAIGYLLTEWKPSAERKVVVIQDHQESEVGQSNGGAGKSLLGNAIAKIIPQIPIAGTLFKKDDDFVFSSVTRATRNIFIDDIRPNFDFKHIYPMVTGDMSINPKGKDRFLIPVDQSPKMLITTNHTINGATDGSTRRRIIYMEYSAWYNPDHTPVNDFGHMLFDDWDETQWSLFDNLMAECVMYYLRSFELGWHEQGMGAIPPPMKQIELRTLRQKMSEIFFQWAEEYYDPTGEHLNQRELRSEVYNAFIEFAGTSNHGITKAGIMRRVTAYCQYKGYDFNVNKPNEKGQFCIEWKRENPDDSFIGENDKSNGKEYFTVWSQEKAASPEQARPF